MEDIVIRNLCKSFAGKPVLRDFSAVLPVGQVTGLMAPSGAGKTTLLRILMGLERPDGGTIDGLAGLRLSAVFQEDRLIPSLSARDNVGLVLDREHQELAARYLSDLNLSGWENALPQELSGGMQRRVAIARAFAYGEQCGQDTVYLLDEPLKGLDEETAIHTLRLIRRWVAGRLAFFITHDREQARQIADWIITFAGQPMRVSGMGQNRPSIY